MARQVLPIVGAVIGAYFGSPQIGYALGTVAAGLVDPAINQGPKIGDTGAQTSQEGAPRAIIYGTASCTGNIIAAGPVIKSTETEEAEGGKGAEKSEVEHAYRNYAIRICEGPITGVLRIWEDDKLVYDIRPGSLMLAESAKWMQSSTQGKILYLGDEDQLPSSYLNLNVPPLNEHPAHRGTAYMVFGLEDLTERRGSIPQYRFEVATAGYATFDLNRASEGVQQTAAITGGLSDTTTLAPVTYTGRNTVLVSANFYTITPGPDDAKAKARHQTYVNGILVDTRDIPYRGVADTTPTYWQVYGGGHDVRVDSSLVFDPPGAAIVYGSWNLLVTSLADVYEPINVAQIVESSDDRFGVFKQGDDYWAGPSISFGGTVEWGPDTYVTTGDGLPVALSNIVGDIHARCEVPASKVDVSELTDMVTGLVLAGDYMGADAINTLRTPYFFDKCEYSKKLHYPKRGGAVVATLTVDDLVEEPDLSRREQAVEFPKKMHLFYQHAASGYAAVKATSLRSSPDARVVGETSLQVPVVLDEDQAAQTVSKLHKVSWAEAEGEITLSVPQSLMRLVPSDNVGLSLRGQTKRLRIEKREFAAGVINLTLRHDRQSAYTSTLTGVPIPLPTLPPSTIVGDTTLAILDIGSRIDTEDDLHYLAAGTGVLPAWYGYGLQRSLDAGASYATVDRFGSSLMGSLVDAVPAASEYFTDTTNTVRVQLFRDGQTLEDLTDVQFLSEQGAFALQKADGSWEVMQYRDANPEGGGVFALTTLHRGQLNSGASAHLAGAKFVLLSRAEHIPALSAWIGQPLTHRAASLGDAPELATPQTATYLGRSQLEWPVASLTLSRAMDIVSGVIVPRHRFGTDDAPVASANFTGYRVSIAGTSTVTFDSLTPTFTYDVSAIGGAVTVSVSALNRITGAGPAVTAPI